MEKLYQNNLEKSTTDLGFLEVLNENAGTTVVSLQREVTLDDGTVVVVEGITPSKMKNVLNQKADDPEEIVTFKTPGENYVENNEVLIKGVVQKYNETVETEINHIEPYLVDIAITTPPTKTVYTEGETFDTTGMVITGYYSNQTTAVIPSDSEDVLYAPALADALTTTDTKITISIADTQIEVEQEITVNAAQ